MIKVASYNIHNGVGLDRLRRPERIVDVLCELDADIIALQEADRRFGTRASAVPPELILATSPYVPVELNKHDHSIGWHGNAILVRNDAEILTHAHIELPTLEPRGAVMAEVRIKGVRLRIVGMHLDLSGLWRRRQARAILAHLAEQPGDPPTVLMGDMNEWRAAAGAIHDLARTYRIVPTGPTFHARMPVAALDRIFVSDDVPVEGAGVHHSARSVVASDHLPVWVRIGWGL